MDEYTGGHSECAFMLCFIMKLKEKKWGIKCHYLQILQEEQGSKNRYLLPG